ncbi:restriction endonuclease, partial [Bacillus altitudinis]
SSESSWVVTNNYFTSPAIELAEKTDVKLFDRDDLVNLILKSKESNEKIIITY